MAASPASFKSQMGYGAALWQDSKKNEQDVDAAIEQANISLSILENRAMGGSIPEFHCALSRQALRLKIRLRLDHLHQRFHRGDHDAGFDLLLGPFPQWLTRCRQAEQIGILTS